LEDAFSKYGKVMSTDLKYGYAFVEFEDSRDAEDAVRYLNGHSVDGSRIAVEHSRGGRKSNPSRGPPQRSDYRVSVDGLPRDVSWQDLKDKFRKAGDVLFADVFTDRSGRFKGVVEFKARDDLRAAIREIDDTEFRGSVIRVKEDDRRRSRSPARRKSRSRSRSPRPSRRSRRKSPSSSRSPRRSYSRSPKRSKRRSPSRSRSPKKASRSRSRSPRASSRSPPSKGGRKASRSHSNSPKNRSSRSPSPHNGNGNNNHSPANNRSPSKSPARNSDKEGSPRSD